MTNMTMTEYDKQAASALLSSLYLSYERVLSHERTITPKAKENKLRTAKNKISKIMKSL